MRGLRSLAARLPALAVAACVGNPVPTSAHHPANPAAPAVVEAAPSAAPSDAPAAKPEATGAELAAYQAAAPVLARHCGRCHIQGGAKATDAVLAHVDMTSYPFSGAHTTELGPALRRVLGADGGDPEMPKDDPGAVRGADLEALLALADAWTAAHPAPSDHEGGHEHHHHGGQ